MGKPVSVKVSSRYQIDLPSAAREHLNIQVGDHLLMDIQDGLIVLLPQPDDFVQRLSGLHRDVWEGVKSDEYLTEERDAWSDLLSD